MAQAINVDRRGTGRIRPDVRRVATSVAAAATVALLISGCAGVGERSGATPPAPMHERSEFVAWYTPEPIVIDGERDAAWDHAAVIDRFYTWTDDYELTQPRYRTEVRVLWDDEHLYVRAELESVDLYATQTQDVPRTWLDDVFEVFIKPRDDDTRYFEFHVTPGNVTIQHAYPHNEWVQLGRSWDFAFDGGLRTAVKVDGTLNEYTGSDTGWAAEMAIPFAALADVADPPRDGTRWTIAFCRYEHSYSLLPEAGMNVDARERPRELSSTARLPEVDFHLTSYYDWLTFRAR